MNYNYHLLFKYIMVGDANSGKSSLLSRFIDNKFVQNYEATLGVEFGSKTFNVGSTIIKAMIWDTAGQQSFKSIVRSYYKCAIIAILVFDITNAPSFKNVCKWIDEIKMHSNENIRIILIGNKIDLSDKRVISRGQAEEFASTQGIPYLQASAKNGVGVSDCFVLPSKQLIKDIQDKKIVVHSDNIGIRIGNPEMAKMSKESIQLSIKSKENQSCSC